MTWDMQKFVMIKMTQPGDIIAAGKFDRGFYVFNLAPFNGLGTSTACLPIIWRGVWCLSPVYLGIFPDAPVPLDLGSPKTDKDASPQGLGNVPRNSKCLWLAL